MGLDLMTSSFLGLRDKLHCIALRYLQSDEEAQDVLQDTWLKLSDKSEVEPHGARCQHLQWSYQCPFHPCQPRLHHANLGH